MQIRTSHYHLLRAKDFVGSEQNLDELSKALVRAISTQRSADMHEMLQEECHLGHDVLVPPMFQVVHWSHYLMNYNRVVLVKNL